jgi:gliding motility-associated-like protein
VNVTGQTASTFTTTTLNNGDVVTVMMSSSDPCANPVIAASNPITITATLVIPSVSITSSTTSICTGGSITFTATPTNGGTTPTYQWKINGVSVTGQTASTFTTTTLNSGDVITVTMSSSDPCANLIIAVSNSITITATSVVPSISIVSSTTSICTGGSVTFTATPTNGGTIPTYQWKINSVNVTGQTASTFITTSLNNGDVVTVTMSSSDPCASPVTAASNPISITATSVVPSVSIVSSITSTCTGGSITFTATPTNGGTTPTYQWKVNGVNVIGQIASTFTTTTLKNGDVVTVAMNSSDLCANPVTVASNSITITATPVIPLVSIASSTTSTCTGESVTFTATPINGGTTPSYQWKINGVNVSGQTASTFTSTSLNNGDVVTVMMSSSDPCANPINAASNTVAVTVNIAPTLIITNPQIFCTPSTVDLTALAIISGSSTGTTYSWWLDAANTIPLPNPNTVAASGTYYIKSQSAVGCFTTKPVTVTIENKIPGIRYPDVTIAVNTPVALQARRLQQNSTYKWSPNRGLNNYNNQDVVFSFDQKTEYLIAITSSAGCVTIDTQLVNIEITQSGIFVPKAWTPNGDGHNDLLFPLTLNIVKINYFRVFNRWGQLMFETNTFNTGWNGIYKGKPQPIEVFTWSVEAVTIKGEIIKQSGNSVLIR